jgi:tetratricopeptide (TPR) repeat protein
MRPGRAGPVLLALLLGASGLACHRGAGEGRGAAGETEKARALIEQGQFDEAVALLGDASDPESLCLLGRAWAGKAREAPLPTPAPGSTVPPLKPEETRALGLLQQAVAARPDLAEAHLAIADLLAPYALAAERAGKGKAPTGGGGGTDRSVERVLREYSDAVQGDPAGTAAAEALVRFAVSLGRLTEADAAYRELLRRRREDPDLLVRYGDFLAKTKGDPEGATSAYLQALIWRPDDGATKAKVARIYVDAAATLLEQKEYAAAETRLKDAKRYLTPEDAASAARVRSIEAQIRDIRGR